MAMDIPTLRKLVSLDQTDPLSRFALGKKLFETAHDPQLLKEAADHLKFANEKSPNHLATYHILAQVLLKLNRQEEAQKILQKGIQKVTGVGEGMGRDLAPAMQELLAQIP